ncbi:MAG: DUF2937 family protein [Pontibacterium sp.]
MLMRMFDKLLFCALFIAAMQVPQLVGHYQQYLAGEQAALTAQVRAMEQVAQSNGFADLPSMIERHLQNPEASVRSDAELKLQSIATLDDLNLGVQLMATGSYIEQANYILSPRHWPRLQAVMAHFEPGLPLAPMAIVWALVAAMVLNGLIWVPWLVLKQLFKPKNPVRLPRKA